MNRSHKDLGLIINYSIFKAHPKNKKSFREFIRYEIHKNVL
jgi:hypothetical protein